VAPRTSRHRYVCSAFLPLLLFAVAFSVHAQQPADKTGAPPTPAQIDLLETKVRFESNGDSRKEVHCIVKINSELGVRQFARLNFDYNRSFENIDIPLVRVTHSSGGTADILPSAISDYPNAAVLNAPAYQDVRVKSVRILGLAPSDTLEYRVITSVTHHPLAPDFWLDHSFDRTGIVSQELFELDVPESARQLEHHFNSKTPPTWSEHTQNDRQIYHWRRVLTADTRQVNESTAQEPDVVLTSFYSWEGLADRLYECFKPPRIPDPHIAAKASELAKTIKSTSTKTSEEQAEVFYQFVSQKIKTVDLPLGATGFRTRSPWETLKSGYATAEDKYALFAALTNSLGITQLGLVPAAGTDLVTTPPRPSLFEHLLTLVIWPSFRTWLDLNVEVAPFKLVPLQFRGKKAFMSGSLVSDRWRQVDDVLPYQAKQTVSVDAYLTPEGKLAAKVHYSMRGDNELLLRVTFHQSPKEKWNEVAQLLALSDGFRGKVESVTASDPYVTKDPFTVEYEISQPKFVDWSKRPVRIPAILPLVGLPDPPAKSASAPIELGTPLDVTTTVTLHLPPGTTVESPAATTVNRDYATFSSQYAAAANTLTASRHIQFLLRELPADRAPDYSAFLHAVQNDQSQLFTLTRPNPAKPANPTKP
jgi:hypothetical protein